VIAATASSETRWRFFGNPLALLRKLSHVQLII